MNGIEIATYAGLILVVPLLVGAVKQLWKSWSEGKSATMTAAFMLVLGVVGKLTVPGAFEEIHWALHILNLALATPAAMVVRDKYKNVGAETKGGSK